MPTLTVSRGRDYSTLTDNNPGYRAKLERMFTSYQSFEAIQKRANACHLDATEFSIPDEKSFKVPKEVILNQSLMPQIPYWPVYARVLEG